MYFLYPVDNILLGDNTKSCMLLGVFSYLVQLLLGVLSFMVLVYKRYRENPPRPWKIWFFDVSKQICSALTAHVLNLFMAIFLSVDTTADECVWYFINLLLDTTLVVFICFALMHLVECIARKKNLKYLKSGLYFEKQKKDGITVIRLKLKMYFSQLMVWLIVVIIVKMSKVIIFGVTKVSSHILEIVGKFFLRPFIGNEKLELLMVMIVFPVLFNAFQFWVLDEVLKLPENTTQEILVLPEDVASAISMETNADANQAGGYTYTYVHTYPYTPPHTSTYAPPRNVTMQEPGANNNFANSNSPEMTLSTAENVK